MSTMHDQALRQDRKTVSIEPAVESEVPEILCIMAFANMHHVPSEEMPDLDWRCFFVARLEGAMVGAAGYRILDDTSAKTTLMAVDPACRGYGIGMLLQERRMRTLLEKGIRKLTTNADRPETIRWYQKHFGYRVVGSLKKVHEFGHPDIHEWTTLETDLVEWGKRAAN